MTLSFYFISKTNKLYKHKLGRCYDNASNLMMEQTICTHISANSSVNKEYIFTFNKHLSK